MIFFLIADRKLLIKSSMCLLKMSLSHVYSVIFKNVYTTAFLFCPAAVNGNCSSVSIHISYFCFSLDVDFLLSNNITPLLWEPGHPKQTLREIKDYPHQFQLEKFQGRFLIDLLGGRWDALIGPICIICLFSRPNRWRLSPEERKPRDVALNPPSVEGYSVKDSWRRGSLAES